MKNNTEINGVTLPATSIEVCGDSFTLVTTQNNPISERIASHLEMGNGVIPVGATGKWDNGLKHLKTVCSALLECCLKDLLELESIRGDEKNNPPYQNLDIQSFFTQMIGFTEAQLEGNLVYNLCYTSLSSKDNAELHTFAQQLAKACNYFRCIKEVMIEKHGDSGFTCEDLQYAVDFFGGIGLPVWAGDTNFFGWNGDVGMLDDGALSDLTTKQGMLKTLPYGVFYMGHDKISSRKSTVITGLYNFSDPMHDSLRELQWQKPLEDLKSEPVSTRKDLRDIMAQLVIENPKGNGNPAHLINEGLSPNFRSNGYISLNGEVFEGFADMISKKTQLYPKEKSGNISHEEIWTIAIADMASRQISIFGLTHSSILNKFCAAYRLSSTLSTLQHSEQALKRHGLTSESIDANDLSDEKATAKILDLWYDIADQKTPEAIKQVALLRRTPITLNPVLSSVAISEVSEKGSSQRSDFIDYLKIDLLPHLSIEEIEVEVDAALCKIATLANKSVRSKIFNNKVKVKGEMVSQTGSKTIDVTKMLADGEVSVLDGANYSHDWKLKTASLKSKLDKADEHLDNFMRSYKKTS